jgi:dTDP-4-amino-4,6-dideoxygalactose transaminase
LGDFPVNTPCQHEDSYSGLHLYVIRLNLSDISKTHRQVFETLRELNIGVNLHYIPVYIQPYYGNLGFKTGYCLEAEQYYAEAISLPMYPNLTELEQDEVVTALKKALGK